jgi:hypothetical protein
VATHVSRVQKNGKLRTDRFEGDGTPEKAPRAAAGPAAAAAGDAHRRPGRRRDDPLLRKPLLAGARAGNPACCGRPGRRGVAGGRKAAACPNRRSGRREPFVRACERTPRGRADSPKAAGGSHRVRDDHPRAGDRRPRLPRDPRTAAGGDLAGVRRTDRPRDHPGAAALVPSHVRARTRRPRACDRVAGDARARGAPDRLCPLLHSPVRRHGGLAGIGVRLRARHLAAALPRGFPPLLRPGCPCRLGAPTEEAQCRRTSCSPT